MRSPSLPFTFNHFKWKSKKRQQVPKLYSNQTNKLVKEIATKMYTERWRVKVDKTFRHGIRKLWGRKTFCMPSLEYSKETFPCQASESDISVTLVLSSEDQALETAIFQTRFHFWFMFYLTWARGRGGLSFDLILTKLKFTISDLWLIQSSKKYFLRIFVHFFTNTSSVFLNDMSRLSLPNASREM